MGYMTPMTAAVNMILTAAEWNTYVRDNLQYLKGNAGAVAIGDNVTVGGAGSSWLMITGSSGAQQIFVETDQAADERYWDILVNSKKWHLRAVNDAYSAANYPLIVGRGTGTAIAYVAVPGALTVGAPAPITAKLGVNGAAMVGAGYYNNASPPADGLCVQGSVGIGTTSPSGQLHIANAAGGALIYGAAGIGATPTTVLSSGAGRAAYVLGTVYANGLGVGTISTTLVTPAGADLYNNAGTDVLRIVASGGSLLISRTAGSRTYDVNLMILYI